MSWQKHIVRDPKIFSGKPTVKGTRVSVDLVMTQLGWGMTDGEIVEYHYPYLTAVAVAACREYVADGQPMGCITDPKIDTLLAAGNANDCPTSEEPGMGWVGRIVSTPDMKRGRPRIKGTALTVARLMQELSSGGTEADILAYYTELTPDDISACRQFVATGEPLTYTTTEEHDAWMDALDYVQKLSGKTDAHLG